MFKSIASKFNNVVNHNNTQKVIYKSIITSRKATRSVKQNATKLKDDTKKTWKDAMSADLDA